MCRRDMNEEWPIFTSTSPLLLFLPMTIRFCLIINSNSRVSSRAMAWDSMLGAYWMLEGLAGADLSANRAQASLSDALLKFDMTLEIIGTSIFFECCVSVNKHAFKMATSVVHNNTTENTTALPSVAFTHIHFTHISLKAMESMRRSKHSMLWFRIEWALQWSPLYLTYTSTPVLCYCCCCRYRHAIVADNSANCATHTTHKLNAQLALYCSTIALPFSPSRLQMFSF